MTSSSPSRRVAIVTGAAQGIGRAIATRLAKDGYDLGLLDLPECRDLLEGLATKLREERGIRVLTVYGDVSVEEDVKSLVDSVVRELGDLYAMIANAGTSTIYVLHETPTDVFQRLMDVNVRGIFFCYKYAAMRLIEQGKGGRIVGAASAASKKGVPGQSVYSATKFAIRGMTQSAAMDYGKYNITVNAYAPGAVDTPLMDKVDKEACERAGVPVGTWRNARSNLLGRYGQPEYSANLVSFLLSEDASFITGQSYVVDGGTVFD